MDVYGYVFTWYDSNTHVIGFICGHYTIYKDETAFNVIAYSHETCGYSSFQKLSLEIELYHLFS